eukprot:COSAG01_NODE_4114_length_5336_cov_23.503055_7_plen_98_part_00
MAATEPPSRRVLWFAEIAARGQGLCPALDEALTRPHADEAREEGRRGGGTLLLYPAKQSTPVEDLPPWCVWGYGMTGSTAAASSLTPKCLPVSLSSG